MKMKILKQERTTMLLGWLLRLYVFPSKLDYTVSFKKTNNAILSTLSTSAESWSSKYLAVLFQRYMTADNEYKNAPKEGVDNAREERGLTVVRHQVPDRHLASLGEPGGARVCSRVENRWMLQLLDSSMFPALWEFLSHCPSHCLRAGKSS